MLAVLVEGAPEVLDDRADVASPAGRELASESDTGQRASVDLVAGGGVAVESAAADRAAAWLEADRASVHLELPFADSSDDGVVVADGVVVFNNNNGTFTAPILKDDGSVQVTTVIENADAPERFDYAISGGRHGTQLRLESDGTVTILTADGQYAGGVAPAWAKDATGAPVRTYYEISGTTLTQVVEHVDADVTADPWLGADLIASTRWIYVSGSGWRLSVTPTTWGKTTGVGARWAAWDEVKVKTSGTRENTEVYEKQLLCHFDGRAAVIAREGWNATWDLEGWRPNVSYTAYVRALCNPT